MGPGLMPQGHRFSGTPAVHPLDAGEGIPEAGAAAALAGEGGGVGDGEACHRCPVGSLKLK